MTANEYGVSWSDENVWKLVVMIMKLSLLKTNWLYTLKR